MSTIRVLNPTVESGRKSAEGKASQHRRRRYRRPAPRPPVLLLSRILKPRVHVPDLQDPIRGHYIDLAAVFILPAAIRRSTARLGRDVVVVRFVVAGRGRPFRRRLGCGCSRHGSKLVGGPVAVAGELPGRFSSFGEAGLEEVEPFAEDGAEGWEAGGDYDGVDFEAGEGVGE